MKFTYTCNPAWPPLAWLARCEPGAGVVAVMHGSAVEATEDWFCEAVWDGVFDQGDFDRTDIVAGSGGRKRGGQIIFVSSGNTIDRLVSLNLFGTTLVSNSLVCLAAAADLDFLVRHNWYAAFHSIVRGIDRYQDRIPCSRGFVGLAYYRNLCWDGRALDRLDKPWIRRDLSSFESYYGFLADTLHRVRSNACSGDRCIRFPLLTSISTGYDSTAVSTVAKAVDPGVKGFTLARAAEGSRDSGEEIAAHLALDAKVVDIDEWRGFAYAEIPHIAADSMGEEVQYTGAESILKGRVLLTGVHGDVVWSKNEGLASTDLTRDDPCGLSLTEYRLWAGFLHCPIPFWGARQSADLIRLSNHETMKKWDVGGDYSRPVCRRIVESAGVPRSLFGTSKKAASSWPYMRKAFLTPESMESYLQWLSRKRPKVVRGPLAPLVTNRAFDKVLFRLLKTSQRAARALGERGHSIAAMQRLRAPLYWFDHLDWAKSVEPPWVLPLRRYTFPWALELAKRRYADLPSTKSGESPSLSGLNASIATVPGRMENVA